MGDTIDDWSNPTVNQSDQSNEQGSGDSVVANKVSDFKLIFNYHDNLINL